MGKPEKVVPGKPSLVAEGDVTAKWQKAPPGIAAVYLLDPSDGRFRFRSTPPMDRCGGSRLPPKPLPPSRAVARQVPRRRDGQGRGAPGRCVFRGHEWAKPFDLGRGVEIAYEPQPPKPARVQVRGKAMQEACPVVFVIDCSWSMTEKVLVPKEKKPGEAGDPGMEERPRFDVARDSLKSILDSLGENLPDYRIGLIAYGHRVGYFGSEVHIWDSAEEAGPEAGQQPAAAAAGRRPDAATSRGAQRRRHEAAQRACRRTAADGRDAALPGHQHGDRRVGADSPAGREGNRPRRIFVITDGVDQVFKPNGATAEKIANRLRAEQGHPTGRGAVSP